MKSSSWSFLKTSRYEHLRFYMVICTELKIKEIILGNFDKLLY